MVFVIDGLSVKNDVSLCVNGQNVTAKRYETITETVETGSGDLVIGKFFSSYASLWMDELTFWNRVLSWEEIREMYDSDSQAWSY